MKNKIIIAITIICLIIGSIVGLTGCAPQKVELDENKVYTMDIKVDRVKHSCEAVTEIEYKYNGADANEIKLLMNSGEYVEHTPVEKDIFTSAYPRGATYGKVDIKSASINGKECGSDLERNILTLKSNKKIRKGSKTKISVNYELVLPYNNMRYGYNNTTMQFANFYPQLARLDNYSIVGDPFYSSADDYKVTIDYPKETKLIASGAPNASSSDESRIVTTYKATDIRDFAFVIGLVGDIKTKSVDGITVNYLHNADNDSEKSIGYAVSALELFSKEFGEYGKKTFNIVELPFVHGGMEYGDLIYVSNSARGSVKERVIVHETAHQWWYGKVGSDQISHAWQDEGLTEFSVYYYFLKSNRMIDAGEVKYNIEEQINRYRNRWAGFNVPIDEKIDRNLDDFLNTDEYVYAVYNKAFTMFEHVYNTMGDKRFNVAVREYCSKFSGKMTTPQDMYNIFDKHYNGISVTMKAWVEGAVIQPT